MSEGARLWGFEERGFLASFREYSAVSLSVALFVSLPSFTTLDCATEAIASMSYLYEQFTHCHDLRILHFMQILQLCLWLSKGS